MRISTSFALAEKFYAGPWFCQKDKPLCIAWAFANAELVMGVQQHLHRIRLLSSIVIDLLKTSEQINDDDEMPFEYPQYRQFLNQILP
ncbi:MAG: hypothetical protein WCO06_02235 [Candidatus Roizmanbacteria bacterium]